MATCCTPAMDTCAWPSWPRYRIFNTPDLKSGCLAHITGKFKTLYSWMIKVTEYSKSKEIKQAAATFLTVIFKLHAQKLGSVTGSPSQGLLQFTLVSPRTWADNMWKGATSASSQIHVTVLMHLLRTGTSGRPLRAREWTFAFHKLNEITWIAEHVLTTCSLDGRNSCFR